MDGHFLVGVFSAPINQMAPFVVRLMRYARAMRVLKANVRALNSALMKYVHQTMIVQEVLAVTNA